MGLTNYTTVIKARACFARNEIVTSLTHKDLGWAETIECDNPNNATESTRSGKEVHYGHAPKEIETTCWHLKHSLLEVWARSCNPGQAAFGEKHGTSKSDASSWKVQRHQFNEQSTWWWTSRSMQKALWVPTRNRAHKKHVLHKHLSMLLQSLRILLSAIYIVR